MLRQIIVSIREAITVRDFLRVHDIAQASGLTYSPDDKKPHHFVLVAEHSERIVGFLQLRLCSNRVTINKIAVQEDWRRRHVCTDLVNHLCRIIKTAGDGHVDLNDAVKCPKISDRLRRQPCNGLDLLVPEKNILALQVFYGLGFRARHVIPWHFGDQDAFTMHYSIRRRSQTGPAHMPVNRVKNFGL